MSAAIQTSVTPEPTILEKSTPSESAEIANDAEYGAALNAVLQRARAAASAENLGYAGGVTPLDAWQLISAGAATLIDVRTAEERKFVGQIPDSLHVAWATGTAMTRNPRFTRELEAKAKKDQVLLFICRSGKRSADAAQAATKSGFANVFNVLEGFEGEIDDQRQRGKLGGWRSYDLPWQQD